MNAHPQPYFHSYCTFCTGTDQFLDPHTVYTGLWIAFIFADPDPAVFLNADPDEAALKMQNPDLDLAEKNM